MAVGECGSDRADRRAVDVASEGDGHMLGGAHEQCLVPRIAKQECPHRAQVVDCSAVGLDR